MARKRDRSVSVISDESNTRNLRSTAKRAKLGPSRDDHESSTSEGQTHGRSTRCTPASRQGSAAPTSRRTAKAPSKGRAKTSSRTASKSPSQSKKSTRHPPSTRARAGSKDVRSNNATAPGPAAGTREQSSQDSGASQSQPTSQVLPPSQSTSGTIPPNRPIHATRTSRRLRGNSADPTVDMSPLKSLDDVPQPRRGRASRDPQPAQAPIPAPPGIPPTSASTVPPSTDIPSQVDIAESQPSPRPDQHHIPSSPGALSQRVVHQSSGPTQSPPASSGLPDPDITDCGSSSGEYTSAYDDVGVASDDDEPTHAFSPLEGTPGLSPIVEENTTEVRQLQPSPVLQAAPAQQPPQNKEYRPTKSAWNFEQLMAKAASRRPTVPPDEEIDQTPANLDDPNCRCLAYCHFGSGKQRVVAITHGQAIDFLQHFDRTFEDQELEFDAKDLIFPASDRSHYEGVPIDDNRSVINRWDAEIREAAFRCKILEHHDWDEQARLRLINGAKDILTAVEQQNPDPRSTEASAAPLTEAQASIPKETLPSTLPNTKQPRPKPTPVPSMLTHLKKRKRESDEEDTDDSDEEDWGILLKRNKTHHNSVREEDAQSEYADQSTGELDNVNADENAYYKRKAAEAEHHITQLDAYIDSRLDLLKQQEIELTEKTSQIEAIKGKLGVIDRQRGEAQEREGSFRLKVEKLESEKKEVTQILNDIATTHQDGEHREYKLRSQLKEAERVNRELQKEKLELQTANEHLERLQREWEDQQRLLVARLEEKDALIQTQQNAIKDRDAEILHWKEKFLNMAKSFESFKHHMQQLHNEKLEYLERRRQGLSQWDPRYVDRTSAIDKAVAELDKEYEKELAKLRGFPWHAVSELPETMDYAMNWWKKNHASNDPPTPATQPTVATPSRQNDPQSAARATFSSHLNPATPAFHYNRASFTDGAAEGAAPQSPHPSNFTGRAAPHSQPPPKMTNVFNQTASIGPVADTPSQPTAAMPLNRIRQNPFGTPVQRHKPHQSRTEMIQPPRPQTVTVPRSALKKRTLGDLDAPEVESGPRAKNIRFNETPSRRSFDRDVAPRDCLEPNSSPLELKGGEQNRMQLPQPGRTFLTPRPRLPAPRAEPTATGFDPTAYTGVPLTPERPTWSQSIFSGFKELKNWVTPSLPAPELPSPSPPSPTDSVHGQDQDMDDLSGPEPNYNAMYGGLGRRLGRTPRHVINRRARDDAAAKERQAREDEERAKQVEQTRKEEDERRKIDEEMKQEEIDERAKKTGIISGGSTVGFTDDYCMTDSDDDSTGHAATPAPSQGFHPGPLLTPAQREQWQFTVPGDSPEDVESWSDEDDDLAQYPPQNQHQWAQVVQREFDANPDNFDKHFDKHPMSRYEVRLMHFYWETNKTRQGFDRDPDSAFCQRLGLDPDLLVSMKRRYEECPPELKEAFLGRAEKSMLAPSKRAEAAQAKEQAAKEEEAARQAFKARKAEQARAAAERHRPATPSSLREAQVPSSSPVASSPGPLPTPKAAALDFPFPSAGTFEGRRQLSPTSQAAALALCNDPRFQAEAAEEFPFDDAEPFNLSFGS